MKIVKDDAGNITAYPEGIFNYASGLECVELVVSQIKDPCQIRINFNNTEKMDSSGIGALIVLRDKIPANSPVITLINPSSEVTRVLEMCCMNRLFNIICER